MPSLYHFLLLRRSPQLGLGFRQLHSPSLDITSPTFAIYGSNTGVGKTLVSAGLAISVLSNPKPSPNPSFLYVKPVQTGFPADSDARFVLRKATALFDRSPSSSSTLLASNHTINASPEAKDGVMGFYEEARVGRKEDGGEEAMLACKTLFGWREAVSAHLAAEREGMRVDDDSLREALGKCLLGFGEGKKKEGVWKVIETAGGIASPGPSGTLQCDLYRPFRFPVILVGDGHLGGISATVSAYESLKIRGYDVTAIILVDHGLSNEVPLISYLRNSVDVLVLPPIPEDPSNNLIDWFCESSEVFSSLQEKMFSAHVKRLQRLHDMPQKAGNIIWWPFTQHQLVPEQAVTVIDSRCGENFAVHKDCKNQDMIIPQFDACASWWTQGPDATLQMELAREMGYSAGRYGHVMFPENVHEPALRCAELLLEGVGKGWATRAYFSDNGSTAVEIALKMAFRKFSFDHGIHLDSHKGIMSHGHITIKVLALNGSYHGDTLGAMEAQAPSSFTSSLQQPWYSGRGLFLDPPTIFMSNETWTLSIPDALNAGHLKSEDMWFNSRDELFSRSRDSSAVAGSYAAYISNQLVQFSELSHSTHIGALIIEPGNYTRCWWNAHDRSTFSANPCQRVSNS
ncbi:bifunctional dethiobiotin synthetase/7,8-diamino-pelargonic acid aminotransferase, mitochondrial [Iris pallida]|uniref:Bifunctional dethiobiotin synthetase/7,8-diamino-pelargonic acid aminotransferase, mitochondrial n=1 Tax=Iris pallida TaxID=29817 RepID=A0AAX6GLG3_IRIPA|nr:bifunctional dethiobiotin synthetase/7,8-diamino-pelargonic acid aminotransferase, mitochondrial [Iris pallida]